MAGKAYTIGALSDQIGVTVETIRYYERIGLLPPPPRSAGGHRLYGPQARDRLTFIRRGRELGFSLAHIRALLAMVDGGGDCGDVQTLTLRHLKDVRARIADLRRLERALSAVARQCSGRRSADCPVIEVLSGKANRRGTER